MEAATVQRFEANRNRLASIAYRILGSAADAEDVVQDAFLRWQAADLGQVSIPEAWLTRVVTNLSIDRLRSAKARHEQAVGTWLPEPLLNGDPMLGPAETVEQRESVTLAVLTLMERLSPMERAVYVLREAFSHTHAEIAEILDITVSASQQLALRARRSVGGAGQEHAVDHAAAHRIVSAFVAAASSGQTQELAALLTANVTATSDGAGMAKKLVRFSGADTIAKVIRAGFTMTPAKRKLTGGIPAIHADIVNGQPSVIVALDDRVLAVIVLELQDGKIAELRAIAAPARLHRVTEQWRRHRHDDPVLEAW